MTSQSMPAGMVDHLSSSGGQTPEGLDFGRAFVTPGPIDPAVLAKWLEPERVKARDAQAAWNLANDWANLGRYREANAVLAGRQVRTVFLGDSITEAWPLADPELFSEGVIGRGISGQTSAQILLRLTPDAIALRPGSIHLMCGINDIAGNTGPTTPQDFLANIGAMAALVKTSGIRLVLGSITPAAGFGWRPDLPDPRPRILALNTALQELADRHGARYADYHGVLKTRDDRFEPGLTRDGVHPLSTAYARMRPVVERALTAEGTGAG